ncbi:hypothetical protein JTB14_034118 [Gonioctena quinquepunctata]|nr:hypothetical protein JTB14_034118 [Gonioctena quinquepunctata]
MLIFSSTKLDNIIEGYAGADCAGDRTDHKSTTGYIFKVFGNSISWRSQEQSTVALSSTEAEYVALSNAQYKVRYIIEGYAGADCAGDRTDHKSTTGYIFKVFGNSISWRSQEQSTVALSSTEAEYVALSNAVSEACWLRYLLHDFEIYSDYVCVMIFEDNQSAIKVGKNPEYHKRLKHVDIKIHFVRDKIKEGIVDVKYVNTSEQLADMFTKPLGLVTLNKFCSNSGLE